MRRFLAMVIVVLWPLGLTAQVDDDGPGLLARFLQNVLSEDARQVRIRGFQGALSTRATIREITIADEVGDWITVRNAAIDWDRSALLSGQLIIQDLSAEEVILMRRPGQGDGTIAPEASGIGLPRVPISIQIDRIATQRVVLEEAFYGTPATISVNGSVALRGGSGAADLQVLRIDGAGEGSMTLDADYAEETGILNLDFLLTEAANGVLANALQIPDRPSVQLALQGNAPWDDFAASIALQTDGVARLTGTFNTFAADDVADDEVKRRFGADISGDVAPIFAPRYRDFFGNDVALTLAGTTRLDGSLNIDRLQINAGEIALNGSVELDPDRVPAKILLDGRIASADGTAVLLPLPGSPTLVDAMTLDVDFDAERGEDWTGEVVMSGFERPGFTAERLALVGSGAIADVVQAGVLANRVTGDFDFQAEALDLGNDAVQQALGRDVSGRMQVSWQQGQPVDLQTLRIDGESYVLDIVGQVAGVGRDLRVNGAATLSARDLTAFSGLAGRPIGGAADLSIQGNGDLLGGRFDVLVSGQAQDLTLNQPLGDRLLAGTAQVLLHAVRDQTGTRIDEFRVASGTIEASGSGVLRTDATEIELRASLEDAGDLLDGLSGPVTLQGTLRDEVDQLRFDITGAGPGSELTAAGTFGGPATPTLLVANSVLRGTDLSIFAPVVGFGITGSAELSMQTRLDTETRTGTVNLNGLGRNLGVGNNRIDPMLAGDSTVSARLTLEPGTTTLNSFAVVTPILTASAVGAIDGQRRSLTLDAQLADAGLVVESLAGPIQITGQVDQNQPDELLINITGQGPSFSLRAKGGLSDLENVPLFDGAATVQSPDVSVFSALADRPLSGRTTIEVAGATRVDLSGFKLQVSGSGTDLSVGQSLADQLLANAVTFDGQFQRSDAGIRLTDARLDSDAVALTANGLIADGATDLTFDATIKEAALLLRDVVGALGVTGSIRQTREDQYALDITGTGAGTDLAASGTLTNAPTGAILAGAAQLRASALTAFSRLAGRPLTGALDVQATGEARLDWKAFKLDLAGATTDLALGIVPIDRVLSGQARFLAQLERGEAGLQVQSFEVTSDRLSADVQGRIDGADSDMRFAAEIDSRAYADAAGLAPIAVVGRFEGTQDGAIGVTVAGSGPGTTLQAQGRISDGVAARMVGGTADVSVGDLSAYSDLIGRPLSGDLAASARGELALDLSAFDVVASGAGRNLLLGNRVLDRLIAGRAVFRVDAARRDGRTTIRDAALETPALSIAASNPDAGDTQALQVSAQLNDVAPFLSALSGPATAIGTLAEVEVGIWRTDLAVRGPGGITADVSGTLGPAGNALQVVGSGPLDFTERYLGTRSVTGTAFFDLAFDGTSDLRGLSGTVMGEGVRIFAPKLNSSLADGQFRVDIAGGRAWVEGAGTVTGGGTIGASGSIALMAPFPARMALRLDQARLRDPTLYDTTLTGDVTISGPLVNGGRIDGALDLGPMTIRFPTGSIGVRGPIPVIGHLNEPAAVRRTRQAARLLQIDPRGDGSGDGRRPPFDLNIQVNAPQVMLSGLGLDARFAGHFRLDGNTLAVKPIGQLGLKTGRFDFMGRQLTLTQGGLRLEGSFIPVVRLAAHIRDGDVDLRATLEGPVMTPSISFASVPELPENQIIARLLYRDGAERLSGLQAARIATSAMQLGGPAAGSGIISGLREGAGVDYLDLAEDAEGGVALRAGKTVAKDTYAEVTVGENTTDLSIRLNLNEDVTLKGSVDSRGESRLGLFFETDY